MFATLVKPNISKIVLAAGALAASIFAMPRPASADTASTAAIVAAAALVVGTIAYDTSGRPYYVRVQREDRNGGYYGNGYNSGYYGNGYNGGYYGNGYNSGYYGNGYNSGYYGNGYNSGYYSNGYNGENYGRNQRGWNRRSDQRRHGPGA